MQITRLSGSKTALGSIAALALACSHYPVNAPLTEFDPQWGYRYANLSHEGNSDEIFICLTLSGGGGRAAALSYGVLQQLRDTEIIVNGEPRRMLDEVDVISSVSGGSFTAAHYVIHRDDTFETYERDFLHRNYQRRIVLTALNPLQWFRYLSPRFTLTDRAAELYDHGLFDGITYGDLASGSRPFLILNATDITLGQPFQFTQEQFDYLHSDLSSMSLARAVTASSAVPVLLRPVTLRSHHPPEPHPLPEWVTQQIASPDYPSLAWQQANQLLYYRDPEKCQFVHLVDGGISDNLGLRPLFRPHPPTEDDLSIGRLVNLDRMEHAVLITVNAANSPDTDWTQRERSPGAVSILNRSIAGLMTNTTTAFSREVRNRLISAQSQVSGEITMVEVGFNEIPDLEARTFFRNVATTLALDVETLERLIDAGAQLLAGDPEYQRLVEELGGTIRPVQRPSSRR